MSDRLRRAIEFVAEVMPPDTEDWWIIGSAAMNLVGVATEAKDVDVFGSEATIAAVVQALSLPRLPPSRDPLFRSTVFACHEAPGQVPVEFMGGFEVKAGGTWQPLSIRSRLQVTTARGPVFVPNLEEQVAILELFGRDKDLRRAELIRRFLRDGGL